MCYVCNCFAWSLDLFQRAITFCLACCAACVVCVGLLVTVIAGVAYGYNYSFAEFITYTKSDVTVYMRRGQFYDHPDIAPDVHRRMGKEDVFPLNPTEYEEPIMNNNSESLAEKWLNDQDAREYAIKLTKYSGNEKTYGNEPEIKDREKMESIYKPTLPPLRRLSKIPIQIPTTIWRRGNSEIVMRKFLPLNDITEDFHAKGFRNYEFDKDNKDKSVKKANEYEYRERQMEKILPEVKIRIGDNNDTPERKLIPLSPQHIYEQDDFSEVGDEDNSIYKPV